MTEELAVIHSVGFGNRDANGPCLWFGVYMLHGTSLQILKGTDILDFVKKSGVYDIRTLEGKSCVVDVGRDRDVKFVRFT